MYGFYNQGMRGKPNTDWEILLKTFATAYDSHNDIMVTQSKGKFNPTTLGEIKKRFADLKRLSRKYCPQKLRTIEKIEKMALDNHSGKINDRVYINGLRYVSLANGINNTQLDQAEGAINAAEGRKHMSNTFKMPSNIYKKKPTQRRQGRYGKPQKIPNPNDLIRGMFGFGNTNKKRGGR